MNKYLLFGGKKYHPNGGVYDYIAELNSIDEAYPYLEKAEEYLWTKEFEWAHILVITEDGIKAVYYWNKEINKFELRRILV